jgi:hypothetical protein
LQAISLEIAEFVSFAGAVLRTIEGMAQCELKSFPANNPPQKGIRPQVAQVVASRLTDAD